MKANAKKTNAKPLCHFSPEELAYMQYTQEVLLLKVIQTVLGDGYYQHQPEATQTMITAASRCEPIFIAKLAIYARHTMGLRRASHLLAGILAPVISGQSWGKHFYFRVVKDPEDMTDILMFIDHQNRLQHKYRKSGKIKVPHALKAGFRKFLEQLEPAQMDRYKMKRRKFSMVDLINFFHPVPNNKNREAFRRLQTGQSLTGLYDPRQDPVLLSAASKNLDKYTGAVLPDATEITRLLKEINEIEL